VVPERLLDTRNGLGYTGRPGRGQIVELQVTGAGNTAVPADAKAAVVNITATGVDEAGFVTVWPCGQTMPTASNLNLTAGLTTPNLVISKIGDSGKICIFTQNPAHLIADIAGYMP
jgi:hypothetical protein